MYTMVSLEDFAWAAVQVLVFQGWISVVQVDLINSIKDLRAQRGTAEGTEVRLQLIGIGGPNDSRPERHQCNLLL